MKVVLLAPANSVHTLRWANGLAGRGLEVHLVSLHQPLHAFRREVNSHTLPFGPGVGYVLAARALRDLLREITPDLLNAHYASGYGLLARLSGFAPSLLSVWGGDVYDFPGKSPLHRYLVRSNLKFATQIASTSHCMARKVHEILPDAKVVVTPFGVDEVRFHEEARVAGGPRVTIGTVKTLAPKYGVDTLIQAFALLKQYPNLPELNLEIAGDGPQRSGLELLTRKLGLGSSVVFHGALTHDHVPDMLSRLDVFVALSRLDSESFGVAAVEAAMCGLPVVASDAAGFVEVVEDGATGFIVPRNNPDAAARALNRLASSAALRKQMGNAGRARALKFYTLENSLDNMIGVYKQTIAGGPRHAVHGVT